ncbi:MAG: mechanosensitive ion channel domain-containing protein [bacterium]
MEPNNFIQLVKKMLYLTIITINNTHVTVLSLFLFIFLLFFLILAANFISKVVMKKVLSRFMFDKSVNYAISRIIYYMLVFASVVFAFQFIGIDFSGLVVVFGFLSVGIGFGLQNITSNFVSGIILLLERPVKIGDRVSVGTNEGDVLEINMRSTIIRSLENISIIVPNSDLIASPVINWSHGDKKVRLGINVGISYQSDVAKAMNVLLEVAKNNKDVLKSPEPFVRFMEFGDSSLNMLLGAWIDDPKDFYSVRSDLNCAIVEEFRKHKIEIPFPQRDVNFRYPIPASSPKL